MPRIFLPWAAQTAATRSTGIISRLAQSQPINGARVDWANPLNTGLAYLYSGMQSAATRKPIFSKGAADIGGTPDVTLEGTPGGIGLRQNGSSIFRPFGANSNLSSAPGWSTGWTRFAIVYADAAPGSGDYAGVINGDKAGAMTWNHPSGGFQGVITAYYLGYYSASFGTLNGKTLYVLVGTHNSVTGNLRAYKNGVLENQTTGVNAVTSDSTTESLGYDAGGNPFPGVILMAGAVTREWSQEEVARFARNPWQLFERRLPFSLPLQSAPTAKWSLRRSLVARSQPRIVPAINRTNKLLAGNKVLALVTGASRKNLATLTDMTVGGTVTQSGRGSGMSHFTGSAGGELSFTTEALGTNACVEFWVGYWNTSVTQVSDPYIFGDYSGGGFGLHGSSNGGGQWGWYDAGTNLWSGETLVDGRLYCIAAVRHAAGTAHKVYRDGILFISGAATGSRNTGWAINSIGPGQSGTFGASCYTLMAGRIDCSARPWTPADVAEFSRNPWQLLVGGDRDFFLIPGASTVNDFTALLSEGASLADAIGAVLGISASATEAATLADTLDGALAFTAAATESVTLADSESGVYGISSSITESMTLSDAASLIYGLAAEVSEALAADAAQDGSVPTGDFSASLSDAAALADSASSGLWVYAAISAALSLADALSGAMAAGADAGDALTLDEAATRVLGLFSQASEASALDDLSDSVRGVTGGVTEALTATSGQAAVLSSFAGIDESMTLSELEASAKGYAVAIVGALALLEALRARLDRAFAASGARGGRAALDTGSRGGRATSARLGRTDSSRRTRH